MRHADRQQHDATSSERINACAPASRRAPYISETTQSSRLLVRQSQQPSMSSASAMVASTAAEQMALRPCDSRPLLERQHGRCCRGWVAHLRQLHRCGRCRPAGHLRLLRLPLHLPMRLPASPPHLDGEQTSCMALAPKSPRCPALVVTCSATGALARPGRAAVGLGEGRKRDAGEKTNVAHACQCGRKEWRCTPSQP